MIWYASSVGRRCLTSNRRHALLVDGVPLMELQVVPHGLKRSLYGGKKIEQDGLREFGLEGDRGDVVFAEVIRGYFSYWDESQYPPGQEDVCVYCGTPNYIDGKSFREGYDCFQCGSN